MAVSSAIPAPEEDFSFFDHVDRNARIVGGTTAAEGSHPHTVATFYGLLLKTFLCGGSIISPRHVLTAAHCIDAVYSFGSLRSTLRVTVGTNRWNQGGVTYSLAGNVTHQNYVSGVIKNDIGLLITDSNIAYSTLVQPIQLSFDFVGSGVQTNVAGWGRIWAGGALSANLLEVSATTIDGDKCVADAAEAAIVLNRPDAPHVEPHIELCTFRSIGFGTCNGDSGSALSRVDTKEQIGIVSWGFPCALGAPDMFVRVSAYRDWILQNL